ncbi:Nucleotidyltransferase, predicted [Ruminiclostridium papyrosolvens DSM 2782]|uniref:Nucleotidyltransferase, predicted n=1 Tax=Ruminiclostridium papyrosolvens DSM 2782 TaxID=588581 RepID=F1T838_9FIRM|nr:nucleotidyltransferase domain-containing protein [Ruminiclostridium papyrosolvens]EGD49636.1 Nucleotidyltransferase, predicted [Ruminiclostridium papyrosolvens DSM 2782]WES33232.1 nucleotidyltransferase domain-containing protein [Ruminiclostridium papyrosolvens DSM 2782]
MDIQALKDKLNSKEYDFLRKDSHLGDNILILTTGGSIAYGTNVDTSDIDIRGVTLENKQDIMGLSDFEQFEDKSTDTVIYGLKKFILLCINCNPNVLEILGTKQEHLLVISKEGELLRDNVELFLSKRAIQSFGSYATAQLRRLQNALARDNYPHSEKEQHILNSILSQMEHLQRSYKSFTNKEISLYIDKSDRQDMDTEIFIDVNLKHYPLRDFKNIYSDMNNIVKDYSKLNHRNSKKDELHLNKHAMHLIRLLVTGTEILKGKGVTTYREKERAFFLDIRSGKYSYTEIFEMVDDYENEFKLAAANTALPDKPDYKRIEELMLDIYSTTLP